MRSRRWLPLCAWAGVLTSAALTRAQTLESATRGEVLEVREGGAVLAAVRLTTPASKRGAPKLRAVEVDGHRILEVRVPVQGDARERTELWVADAARPRTPLFSGLVGAQDVDRETFLEVDVSPAGIEAYQLAPRLALCDGERPRLFVRRWDFATRAFLPSPPPQPPRSPNTLAGRRGDGALPRTSPAPVFHWTAASSGVGARDARSLGAPLAVGDGDPKTAWHAAETGASLTARAAAAVPITGIALFPGAPGSGRPRSLAVIAGPKPEERFEVELGGDAARADDPFWIPLPRPVSSACVSVVIRDVVPGARPGVTVAIGELQIFSDVDGEAGIARLVGDARGEAACEARVRQLVDRGAAAVGPVARSIGDTKGPGRVCLVEALVGLVAAGHGRRDEAVASALAGVLRDADEAEEQLVARALPHLEIPPVEAVARTLLDPAAPEEARGRAARALGRLRDAGSRGALLRAAGAGSPLLRGAVRGALLGLPAPFAGDVLGALRATPAENRERRADLALILGAAALREPEAQDDAVDLLRSLAETAAASFEERARAIQALGRLARGEAGTTAVTVLAAAGRNAGDPVLRYLAVRELGGSRSSAALSPLHAALVDADPRVRETAALATGERQDRSAAERLLSAARQERWPFVRRAQLTALGALCPRGGADLLVRASAREAEEVRRAALTSLTRCRDPRARPLLLRLLGRSREAAGIRALAARLLGDLKDPAAAPELAAALDRLRRESEPDLALEGVAADTMRALGETGGEHALTSARALLGDRRPVLRRAAVEALGRACGSEAVAQLTRAKKDPDEGVAAAADAGLRLCAAKMSTKGTR